MTSVRKKQSAVPVWQTLPSPEPLDLHQHRVLVAIHEDVDDLELVARGLALHPHVLRERLKNVAKPLRRVSAQRDLVHEADHQTSALVRVLDDRRNQSVQF
jgi:hypothetical protein